MPIKVRLRGATPGDVEALLRLLDELGYPTDAVTLADRLDRLLTDHAARVFVAEQSGRILGLASMHVLEVLERPPLARLDALVVASGARGRGVGRRLVERVEAEAQACGCERLEVISGDWREEAHAFYGRLGFEQRARRLVKALGAGRG